MRPSASTTLFVFAALLIYGAECGYGLRAFQHPAATQIGDDAGNVAGPTKDEQIAALDRRVFERDNEILHLKTEWATCRASLDATELSAQATELVRRCEIATGGRCEWDNGARKVIIIGSKESK